jgi:integrase
MGLGPLDLVPLAEARELARDARRLLLAGRDPIDERKAQRKAGAPAAFTFRAAAERYIAAHEAGWTAKHGAQWSATLAADVFPVIGELAVADVDTAAVLRVLQPIWTTKPETASRVRGRIESVLAAATVTGLRSGANPAAWRGHLDQLLPARRKVRAVQHHPAMPYRELPAFMARLRQQPGTAARALEFAVLTAARSGEVRGATFAEIDRDRALWTIAANRMKGGREHRVPLVPAALALVDGGEGLLFPGRRRDRPLSDTSMLMLLRRMGCDVVPHGFRSTFRDFAAEVAHAPREVAEAALAHRLQGVRPPTSGATCSSGAAR